jgi:two-component system, cell cycle sensor histidine kinase and response regulator CckA
MASFKSTDPQLRTTALEAELASLKAELKQVAEERTLLKTQLLTQHNTYKDLGQRLSGASSDNEVATIILDSAKAQIGWDAAHLAIYDPKTDLMTTIAEYDLVEGVVQEFTDQYTLKQPPGPISRRVLQGFSFYGNRDQIVPQDAAPSVIGTPRPSESIIITPLIDHHKTNFGIISIHSYKRDVYKKEQHSLFRSLADFCGDALLRSHAETNLRLSEERLNFALSGTNLGVWDWNLETDEVSFTEKFTELLGYNLSEVKLFENFWSHLTHKEDMAIVLQKLEDHIQGKTPLYEMRRRMRRKDGHWRWFVDRGKVVDRNKAGKPIRITGTISDVTHELETEKRKKELEGQLQQAQKLESLGLLAGGIAHDFNNLLVSISGNLELAIHKLGKNHELFPLLNDAEAGALQAARLTEQILAYAGKTNFRLELFNFSEMVQNMAQLLSISISKKIELKLQLNHDIPSVEGDLTQLRQVVMNLITNAADAIGRKDGEIMLSTILVDRKVPPTNPLFQSIRFEPGPYVCFTVKDTGCGMDPQTQNRIFDPFFTTKPQGKGLGLAATLGIIRSHQGFLEIDSTPKVGTTFCIFIPVRTQAQIDSNKKEESSSGRFPIINPNAKLDPSGEEKKFTGKLTGKTLIIDDESAVRDVAARMLNYHGMETMEANNGKTGLEMFLKHRTDIDILLLDCMMPIMTGFEVYEEIRKLDPKIPILFSSGYNEHDGRDSIVKDPYVGFIQKPYRKATLLTQINQLLNLP